MPWNIEFEDAFEAEFDQFSEAVQDKAQAMLLVLEEYGPKLGRPRVDTLNGSKHNNMKELRFSVDKEVWRLAFAFDPERTAILLTAGDKAGENEKQFYKALIRVADKRYDAHLKRIAKD